MTKRRTVCFIDQIEDGWARVTVAGVPQPVGAARIPVVDLPTGAEAGKIFFAWANLNAETPDEIKVERIEPRYIPTL